MYDWCIAQSSLHTSILYHSISHSQLPQWACTARRLLLPKHCDSRPPSQLIIRFAWCLCRVFRRPCDGRTSTTIFVLTSVVRLTISLLDKWILEKHGGTRLPTLPQQETIQINTCQKEGELGSSCDCALPRTKVRCPFRHGPPTPSACTAPLVWLFWRGQCDRPSVWPSASAHNPRVCCTYDNCGHGSFWAENSSPTKQQMMVMFRTKMYQGTSSRQRGAGKPIPIITDASPWCFLMILIDLDHTIVI